MKSRLTHDTGGERTFVAILSSGEEAMKELTGFAKKHKLSGSRVSAIGGFEAAELGFFAIEKKSYEKIPVPEQTEVLSLDGDIALDQGEPKIHLHAVLGRRDGTTVGGHLMSGRVRPTLEVVIVESPAHLRREFDPESGLPLIAI